PQGASTAEIENTYASAQQLLAMSPDPSAADNEAITLKGMLMHVFSILRIVNDSVYIFNFNNNILSVYSPSNEYVRQVPFGVSTRAIKYRKKSILVDEEKQECYFKYKRWGYTYLQKINLATGNISYTIKLKYPFIDKVCVSDGYAYFCYFNTQDRDNIYNGKTCLYKQKLD
ncbi:MAG TPA: hypothetical protein VNZ45_16380, partial [Bacteroidia bacterium]|nr:hypothetical protein [Bacteroidia bacterium]